MEALYEAPTKPCKPKPEIPMEESMTKEELESCRIDSLEISTDSRRETVTIDIEWSGDIGFGEYELVIHGQDKDNPQMPIIDGYSECMDSNENKSFIKQLLLSLVDQMEIKE